MRRLIAVMLLSATQACAEEARLDIPDKYPLQDDPCERFEGRDDLLVFELYPEPDHEFEEQFKGHKLQLPPEYFWRYPRDMRRLAGGNGRGAISFHVRAADFAPFGKDAPKKFGFGLTVLVGAYRDLDDPIMYGPLPDQRPDQTGVPEGLTLLKDEDDGFRHFRLYLAYDEEGKVTDYLRCQKVHSFVAGGCEQIVEGRDEIDFKFSYKIDQLPLWRQYGDGMRRFYDCMRDVPQAENRQGGK